ncbi:MAG: hypothetical protein E7329_03585 [Clostridiales bacterium]|nr:hypothetical protein [Clostridiales bacterium]
MKGLSFAPVEAKLDQPRVVLSGDSEVLIEQHAGLFSYESKCVRVRTKRGLISVTGENLLISYFGIQDLMIQGHVSGIALQGETT